MVGTPPGGDGCSMLEVHCRGWPEKKNFLDELRVPYNVKCNVQKTWSSLISTKAVCTASIHAAIDSGA